MSLAYLPLALPAAALLLFAFAWLLLRSGVRRAPSPVRVRRPLAPEFHRLHAELTDLHRELDERDRQSPPRADLASRVLMLHQLGCEAPTIAESLRLSMAEVHLVLGAAALRR